PFLLRRRNALFAGNENRGAEPAVLQPERIELGVAAHEHDGKLPTACPTQNPADSPRAAREAGRIEDDEIELRSGATQCRLECGHGRARIEQKNSQSARARLDLAG